MILFGNSRTLRARKPEADHRIGNDDSSEDEDAEAGEKDETSVESGSRADEGSAAEGFENECECKDCECRGRRAAAVWGPKSLELAAIDQ